MFLEVGYPLLLPISDDIRMPRIENSTGILRRGDRVDLRELLEEDVNPLWETRK